MSPDVQLHLALILFLPWFAILGTLYWLYPRQPRPPARRWWDLATLVFAVLVFIAGTRFGHGWADRGYGPMWQQVVATSLGYAAFLAVMTVALLLRRRWLRRLGPRV